MDFCEGASIRTDDEGQAVTITLLASSEEWYALLCETLSAERLQEALSPLGVEGAVRAETPGILALRFRIQRHPSQGTPRPEWILSLEAAFRMLLKGLGYRLRLA